MWAKAPPPSVRLQGTGGHHRLAVVLRALETVLCRSEFPRKGWAPVADEAETGEHARAVAAVLEDATQERAVTFAAGPEGGLEIALRWWGEHSFQITFPYADFTPVSLAAPWELLPAAWRTLSLRGESGQGVVFSGETAEFQIQDRWAWQGEQLWIRRRWRYRGSVPRSGIALGSRIPLGAVEGVKATVPGVSYNGNPSADPARLVPRLLHRAGSALIVEEHRLPIPGVNIEWSHAGERCALTVLALPAQTGPGGTGREPWWTLGGACTLDGFDILSLSGVTALNGERDMIYGAKNSAVPYPGGGYLTLRPDDALEKTLVLDFGACPAEGHAFGRFVRVSWEVLQPRVEPALSPEETVVLKSGALRQRWRTRQGAAGFLVAPATQAEGNIYDRAPGFLFGWTGQSLRLAWCALALAGEQPEWGGMGQAVLDSFAQAPPVTPGLRPLYFAWDEGRWYADAQRRSDRFSSRMVGEALSNLADCLLLLRARQRVIAPRWSDALREGLTFLASSARTNRDGVFPCFFDQSGQPADQFTSAAGLPGVVGLLLGSEFLADAALRTRALELLQLYYDLFARTFDRPFSRSTLDAACEDKEAGLYFFLAAYHAYRLTGEERFAAYARLAAEWAATFVYCWDVPLPAASACGRRGFRTSCWPTVSVQHHHLDVFFFPWEIYDLGRRLEDRFLQRLGLGVLRAWTHGIARRPGDWGYPTAGEQGEAFFQTNWSTGDGARGGFNRWNPSWIIGLVLQETLRFARSELNRA